MTLGKSSEREIFYNVKVPGLDKWSLKELLSDARRPGGEVEKGLMETLFRLSVEATRAKRLQPVSANYRKLAVLPVFMIRDSDGAVDTGSLLWMNGKEIVRMSTPGSGSQIHYPAPVIKLRRGKFDVFLGRNPRLTKDQTTLMLIDHPGEGSLAEGIADAVVLLYPIFFDTKTRDSYVVSNGTGLRFAWHSVGKLTVKGCGPMSLSTTFTVVDDDTVTVTYAGNPPERTFFRIGEIDLRDVLAES